MVASSKTRQLLQSRWLALLVIPVDGRYTSLRLLLALRLWQHLLVPWFAALSTISSVPDDASRDVLLKVSCIASSRTGISSPISASEQAPLVDRSVKDGVSRQSNRTDFQKSATNTD